MGKTFDFDKPTPGLIQEYGVKFDYDEPNVHSDDYYKDQSIIKLFHDMPYNTKIDEVLAKVTLLNTFYSTQIKNKDLINVARDIIDLEIDDKIHGNEINISVVNEIAYKHKLHSSNLYSFASKYCSFHNEQFPIADSYSKGMLYYMNKSEKLSFTKDFKQKDLNDYTKYFGIYKAFVEHFKLGEFTYKKIDKYLWKYAKQIGESIMINTTGVDLEKSI